MSGRRRFRSILAFSLSLSAAAMLRAALDIEPAARYPYALDKTISIRVTAPPIDIRNVRSSMLSIGEAAFHRTDASHLAARLDGSITTAADLQYRIEITIRNGDGKPLGSAATIEHIHRIEIGHTLTVMRKWSFDLGLLERYASAATFEITIVKVAAPLTPRQALVSGDRPVIR